MSPILKLFATPTLAEILSLLFLNSEGELYQLDIAKRIGKGLIQVQRSLKILEEVGLVSTSRQGRMIYYKIVKTHPAFEDLKRLFLKTISLNDRIREALLPFHGNIDAAFIFGSIARGNETPDSDIDLLIVADVTLLALMKALGPLSRELDRELNPVVFGIEEFQEKISKKDHFLMSVMHEPKLWVAGVREMFNLL